MRKKREYSAAFGEERREGERGSQGSPGFFLHSGKAEGPSRELERGGGRCRNQIYNHLIAFIIPYKGKGKF